MSRFQGKVAIVTGAAGGIGAATAQRLAGEGARLVLADRDADGLAEIADGLARGGAEVETLICDVGDESHMDALIALASQKFGALDIGILNAGTEGRIASIDAMTVSDFDDVYRVNVRSMFIGLHSLLPALGNAGGGAIVMTASTAGLRGNAGMGAYVPSKHAVLGLMKTAAIEGARQNIRVNAVCPGPVDTRMLSAIELQSRPEAPQSLRDTIISGVPLSRAAAPAEIAAMIAFLASADASYCTGGAYVVDGGSTAGPFR